MRCLLEMARSLWGEVDAEGTIDRIVYHREGCQAFTEWLRRTCSSDVPQLELLQSAAAIELQSDEAQRQQLYRDLCGQVAPCT